jgi:hypothetical protein
MGLVLGPDLDLGIQLKWAMRLAEARSLDLLVLQYVESREGKTVEISLTDDPGDTTTPVARQVREMIEASPGLYAGGEEDPAVADGEVAEQHETSDGQGEVLSVRLKEIRCAGLRATREQLLVQIRKNKLKLCTLARRELSTTDVELNRERQLFLRYAPCEVVFCYGLQPESEMTRVLVGATDGAHAAAALRLGRDLEAASGETFTAVRVNPNIGPDAERVGARRLDKELRKALGETLASEEIPHQIRTLTRNHFNAPVRVRLITEVQAEIEPE